MTPELRAQVNSLLEGKDPRLLSPEDSQALLDGRFEDVSVEGSKYLTDGFTTGEVVLHQAGRAGSSFIRGVEELVDIPFVSVDKEVILTPLNESAWENLKPWKLSNEELLELWSNRNTE